jgi:divalent metal cation (Fe/Co/Zn/Cd) transporter
MPTPPVDKPSLIAALIYAATLVAIVVVGHYWHWSDLAVGFLLLLVIGGHELKEVTDKLDAILDSVESLKEMLEELNAKVG